jgi:hypothetical protein
MNADDVLSKGDISLFDTDSSSSLKISCKDFSDITVTNNRGTGVRQVQVSSECRHDSIDAAGEKNVRKCSLNAKNPVVLWVNSENSILGDKLSMNVEDLESKPKCPEEICEKDGMCEGQKHDSWYKLGYAIERMSFSMRVITDGSPAKRLIYDTCSGSEDLNEGNLIQGEECYDNINMEEEEGMFLDHSFSQTLSLGGSPWATNISRNKNEDDDESFQVNPKTTNLYSQESFSNSSLELLEVGEKKEVGSQNKSIIKRNSYSKSDPNSYHQSKLSPYEGAVKIITNENGVAVVGGVPLSHNSYSKGSDNKKSTKNEKVSHPKKSGCVII